MKVLTLTRQWSQAPIRHCPWKNGRLAAWVYSCIRSSLVARTVPLPGNAIPKASAKQFMLLAVNMNFVAFSRFLDNYDGQVFVFFILTVAAAEAAIGLAILVVLFRTRRSINVQELNRMKG